MGGNSDFAATELTIKSLLANLAMFRSTMSSCGMFGLASYYSFHIAKLIQTAKVEFGAASARAARIADNRVPCNLPAYY